MTIMMIVMIMMIMMITMITMVMMIVMILLIVMIDRCNHRDHHDHHDHDDHITSASPIFVISAGAWALPGHLRLPPTSAQDHVAPHTLLYNPRGLSSTCAPTRHIILALYPLIPHSHCLWSGLLALDNCSGRRPVWFCTSWCSVDEKQQNKKC